MRFFSTWIVCISFLLPGFAAEFKVGQSWNESIASRDPLSGLEIRQLTTKGIYNQGPTIHKDTAFPGGKDEVIFAAFRENATLLMSGNLKNGTLTIHDVQPGRYPATGDERRDFFRNIRYQGIDIAASLRHRKVAVARQGSRELRLIDLDSHAVRQAIPEEPTGWSVSAPIFSADGKRLIFCERSEALKKNSRLNPQWPMFYQSIGLDGNNLRALYFHPWGQTHIFPNPVKPELWIVKCGRPEFYSRGEEREQADREPDTFILNAGTAATTPLLPRNPNKRVTHLSWNHDGTRIVYHGQAKGGGNFIGAMTSEGKVLWEHIFADWNFKRNGSNHICADTVGDFIIDDGIAVPGQLSLLDYRNAGTAGAPAIYPIAGWQNEWTGLPYQLSHPHPAVSPDGRYLVFYGCRGGRTHVYCVDLQPLRSQLGR